MSWPDPQSGNLITWDSTRRCQTGSVAIAGYFYVGAYSEAELWIISEANFSRHTSHPSSTP